MAEATAVHCRGYALPLQRRIVDFGAEVALEQVLARLQEPYGIEVPSSAVRAITEGHAEQLYEQESLATVVPVQAGIATVVAELDGSRVPMVEMAAAAEDRRKTRLVGWPETRLS